MPSDLRNTIASNLMMDFDTVNVLVSGLQALQLPPTVNLPLSRSATLDSLWEELELRLPSTPQRYILTTPANRVVDRDNVQTLSSYLPSPQDDILSLHLSIPVLGGKGGFGSQLRAAGGRMSSMRKKHQGEDNGSSRNLDGRRLRTVTEAKALAEYLAIKPDMEKKEKERRRQRWEQIVDMAERKEDEIKHGSSGRLDGKWVDDKEEAGERTRDAVLAAMKSGNYQDNLLGTSAGSSSSATSAEAALEAQDTSDNASSSTTPSSPEERPQPLPTKSRMFLGFDEDDEFMSSDDDEEQSQDHGKGKGKAKGKAKAG